MNSRPPSSALIIHPLPPPPPPSPPPLPPSSPLFLFFPSSCFTFSLNDVGIEVKSGTELYTFVIFLHRQDGPFLLHTKKWISFSPKCLFCHCLYCCYYLHCFCLCCYLRGHFFIVVIFLLLSSLLFCSRRRFVVFLLWSSLLSLPLLYLLLLSSLWLSKHFISVSSSALEWRVARGSSGLSCALLCPSPAGLWEGGAASSGLPCTTRCTKSKCYLYQVQYQIQVLLPPRLLHIPCWCCCEIGRGPG